MTLQVAISQEFFDAFARVPRAQQKKVSDFVSRFRSNPRSPGINYELIRDSASADYRSVRIDLAYRGIVLKPDVGDVYVLLWVDKHDDAYIWAQRNKCEIHPQTGTLQVFPVTFQPPEVPDEPEGPITAAVAPPLFEQRDRELLRIGVPPDRLQGVKELVSIEQLEAIADQLPVEAFEALHFLADGVPWEEVAEEYAIPDGPPVDTSDLAEALRRAQSQRSFHVVEDELELQQMLEAPLEKWRVFLHPAQRALVERHWNGPVRVLGGAGTGKTVVAMHRARWLVRNVLQDDERLLFTTFTRNLAMDIEANLRKICTPEEMQRIQVANLDAWVRSFLKREQQPHEIVYPGQTVYDQCWDLARALADGSLDLADSFYREEWRRVILPQQVNSREEYFRASRVGRGVGLTRPRRAQIWPVFEEMRLQLHQRGVMTAEDAMYSALHLLDQGAVVRPFRAALVDEAQDFGEEGLGLVRALVKEGRDDLMIVGDAHQRIYGRRAPLSRCGINIIGRGRKLRINYRTTEQIRRFAVAVLEGIQVDDLDDGADSSVGYRSLIDGQPPHLQGFADAAAEAVWVAQQVRALISPDLRSQDICIVGRTAGQLAQVRAELEARLDPDDKPRDISRSAADPAHLPGVRMANMHRVKGLEFRVIFLVGINAGVVPLGQALVHSADPVEQREAEAGEKALLHVASTRAVHSLYVSWHGQPSPLLEGIAGS